MRWSIVIVVGVWAALAVSGGIAHAEQPTTEPSGPSGGTTSADLPAPAAMAPTYITIGRELRSRVALIRQTLDDLELDDSIRRQAIEIIDSADADVRSLLESVEAGRMPSYRTVMDVPRKMRAAHAKLLAVIGPDKAQLLEEKLRSLRGEARARLGKLREEIEDLHLSDAEHKICDPVLADTKMAVEKLPDSDVEGDEYATDRQFMDRVFEDAQSRLSKVLSPMEVSRLYPSTQPSPRG